MNFYTLSSLMNLAHKSPRMQGWNKQGKGAKFVKITRHGGWFHYRFFPVKKNYTGKTLFSLLRGFAVCLCLQKRRELCSPLKKTKEQSELVKTCNERGTLMKALIFIK